MKNWKRHSKKGVVDMDSIAQLFNLSEKPSEQGKQVIKQEMYDADLYQDMLNFSPNLKELVVRGAESLATFNNLTQDIYLALFKLHPEIVPDEQIQSPYLSNKQILSTMLDNEDFQRMHSMTRLDSVAAGLGTQVLAQKTIEGLDEDSSDDKQTSPDKGKGQICDSNSVPTPEMDPEIMGDIVSIACKSALDEVKDTLEMGRAWGIEPGDPNARVSYLSKKRALERLRTSPKLKQLTDMVGRLRQVAIQHWKKGTDGVSTIKEVSVGAELERVMPSEMMLLSNISTKRDFHRRYHQRELLQYQNDGIYPKGRGPMVVCCDVSGSMRGKAEEWSKAMVIALAEVALREKRDFACILFDSQLVGTWVIPRGMWDPGVLIDIAETFTGGGTSFTYPLQKCIELIDTGRFKQADVIFLTDGMCKVQDELLQKVNKFKSLNHFEIVSVLISPYHESIASVQHFSDNVINILSVNDLGVETTKSVMELLKN